MIRLRNKEICGELVLAPMAGFTDAPYRKIAKRHGASLTFTELISAEGIVRGNRKTLDLLSFNDEERPIGIQIFGKEPDVMGEAARIVEELNPDLIDINVGCSARKVNRSGSGAALLENPPLLGAIARSMVKSVKKPVSAKIRIGRDNDNKNYLDIVTLLEDAGITLISVHGRTKAQMFGGEADWDIIKEIKEKSKVPIIGNGDITSCSEARRRLHSSGCDAVMIGRGAIGNPWIFSDSIPTINEIIKQIKEHLGMMLEHYGERGIILMRKHIVRYIHGIKNASKIRAALMSSNHKDEIYAILDLFLLSHSETKE
ncbi:MAG: tRNA dihydrouridine synthase DusB [Spirochaetota bacterium]|nr:tRNA dihydrouridine synthase DusB [Spirochaetota bacterium]